MPRALALAERGWGRVHPNPMVGAVIVRNGSVVGEGWHAEYGAAHAERMALEAAGAAARGATLYCTLEPCAHQGKQPPCTSAIIAAGIADVVIACHDPNPEAGGGADRLREAGVRVRFLEGPLADAAVRLNVRFLHRFASVSRPWVAIKLAVTLDGMIADHEDRSQWLSGPPARDWVQRQRANYDAIAVGAVTAVRDDVRLTVRGEVRPRVAPRRVIFDRRGIVPPDHGIFRDAAVAPVTLVRAPGSAAAVPAADGVDVLEAPDLVAAFAMLHDRGIGSILVEGGGRLAGALLEAGLVDRVYQVQVPAWLGDGRPAWAGLSQRTMATVRRWHTVGRIALDDDTVLVLER